MPIETTSTTAQSPERFIAPGKLYINGEWRASKDGRTRAIINPATQQEITQVAEATAADVDEAVAAARAAFEDGPWPHMSVHERGHLLQRVGDLMVEYAEELAYRETINVGKPISFSRTVDAPIAAQIFYYFGGMAMNIGGHTRRSAAHTMNYTLREPLGVVAAITPFNFPLLLSLTKIAPALAAGNTVIHKPASLTPLSALLVAEILEKAGIPKGVFNVITGPGSDIGNALVTHPGINKIAFTGSTEVGKDIIRKSADTLKKTTMELGGKSANIIFADAYLESAISAAFFGVYYNKGELCTAGSRLLVERSIHDEVVERLVEQIKHTRIGDPLDPEVIFGPLASQDQFDKVSRYVALGLQEGATLRAGGKPFHPDGSNNSQGFYYEPTLFTNARIDMRVVQEEIFGPVLLVTPFDSEKEAIELANGTIYGLASGVQTRDIKRAHRVAAAMKAGTCWINTYNQFDSTTPFGGYKASGFGRESGPEVMENYTQVKSVWVDLS
jgi:aldehyde dehydrogenase (NAD+)